MKQTLQIRCKNNKKTLNIAPGSTLSDIFFQSGLKMECGPVCAKVNNKVEGMHYRVYHNKDVEFLDMTADSASRNYTRTLFFILCKAVHDLYPSSRVVIDIPVSNGYFVNLSIGHAVTEEDAEAIKKRMQEIITAKMPIRRFEVPTETAVKMFQEKGDMAKVKLLKSYGRLYTTYYQIDDYVDYYYGSLLTSRAAAPEVRTYRLAPLFRSRFVASRRKLVATLLSISRRLGMLDVLCAFVEAAAMFFIVWLLVTQTAAGAITVGSFVMLFEAFRRGQGYLSSLVGGIAGLYDNRLFVGNLFEFLNLEPHILAPSDPLPVPQEIEEVEFRDITFRYPDMERDVLSHYSLRARRGEVTAVDGRNGYGKSTLIKLLLRFYDPQQGTVLLNGIDIRRFDPDELRQRFGVLFQEFMRYSCTADENIAFGTRGAASDNSALLSSPLLSFLSRLPKGSGTLLSRLFDGGSELSMGQWQRLALARALASDAPVLLLDEPTAWLDADGRETFAQLIEEQRSSKVVLLITHSQV